MNQRRSTDGDGSVALALIQAHTVDCTARYVELNGGLTRVHKRIDWILGAAVLSTLSALGGLIAIVLEHH